MNSGSTRKRDRPPVTRNRFGTNDSQQSHDDRGSNKTTSGSERITSKPLSSRIRSLPQHGLPSPPNTISSADTGSGSVGDSAVKPSSYSSYHQNLSRRNGTATRNNQSSSIQTLQFNTTGRFSTPLSKNSDPTDPANLRPANLFHGSSSRIRLRQLKSVSSLASFKQESNPPRTRPSTLHRASINSTHSSVRRSMDHSSVEGKPLSSTRSHFEPSQTATLPRNSKTTQVRRISSVWKSQGNGSKDAPRHSLEISPTKTIVPPALVTDVPIVKRTSNNDLSNNTLHKASSSNLSITSLNKISVRPSRTGSSGSLDLVGSKVRVRERRSQSTLSKIDEPPSSQRSKKLVSMKEKNKRILANINATLSPPTSPTKDDQHPPSSEPPLPPPPPSSGSSSPSSSSSSDSGDPSATFQSVLSESEPVPVPLDDLESPGPIPSSSRNSLTIPRQSGLIPFAQGYSPSPRKVSNPSQSKAPTDEAGRDEDLRLGSVRGKGPGSRLPLSCFEMGDEDDEMTGKAAETFAEDREQDDLDRTLTQEIPEDKERQRQGGVKTQEPVSNSSSSQSKRDIQTSKLDPNIRADRSISTAQSIANHRLRSTSVNDFTSSDLSQLQHHGDEQLRGSRSSSHHSRQPSESRSMHTSSSETIGKGLGDSRDSLYSPTQSDSYRHSEYECQDEVDDAAHDVEWLDHDVPRVSARLETEEDMRTPVKTRTGLLRHSSSVDEFATGDHPDQQSSRSGLAPLSSISSRRGPVPMTGLPNHQRVSSHDPSSGHHVMRKSEDLSVRQTSPPQSASSSPLQSRRSGTRPSRASSLLPDSRPPSHEDHIDPDLTAHSVAHPSHTYSRASSISHYHRRNQLSDEWDDSKPRSSIFPSSRTEQHPASAMVTSKTISVLPSQSSPPQSYSRRPRPGLPDHFIQPPLSNGASQSSDGRSSSRISAVMSSHSGKQIFDPAYSPDRRYSIEPSNSKSDRFDRYGKPLDLDRSPRRQNTYDVASPQHSPKRYMVNESRRSTLGNSRNSSIDQSGPYSSSMVNGSMSVRELRRGVESSLSFYEPSPSSQNFINRSSKSLFRTKHSSLTDEFGMGNLERSQSVMGGVYDPRNLTTGQLRNRNWNPNNHIFSGHREARARYEEDDDGLSATTYNYPQSHTYTAGSNDSSGRRSKYQESPSRDRILRSESMLNATRRSNVASTPTKHRPSLERDRTVRGSGGGDRLSGGLQLTHVIRGSQDSTRHGSIADHRSSSSGGSSRPQHGQSRMAQASLLGSARGPTRTPNLANSVNHRVTSNTRAPTRAESSRAGALGTGLLSPTPEVEHHKLLIEALESLDQSQLRNSNSSTTSEDDSHSLLVQLVSSVVKHSCRINASLKELVDSGVNSQVELQLLDDEAEDERGNSEPRYSYDERNAGPPRSRKSSSTIRKCEIMQAERSQIERVHGQLIRSSNDQIRDLTETLICLNKLQRKTERESNVMRRLDSTSNPGSKDQRLSSALTMGSHSRSISRASGYFSRSASPTKLRQFNGTTPLSRIDSVNDDSPLARVSKKISVNNTPTSPVAATTRDRQFLVDLPARASTVAFAQNRHHSLGVGRTDSIGRAQKDRLAARSRLSGIEPRASRAEEPIDEFGSYRTSFDSQHSQQSQHQSRSSISDRNNHSEGRTESARQSMDGYQTTHSILNRPQRSSTNQSTSATIRGTQSMMMFPRTPKRLTTSLVTELNAQSHVSPTYPRATKTRQYSDEEEEEEEDYRDDEDGRRRRLGNSINRSQSSMSHILDRAQTMLSRAGHRDDSDLAMGLGSSRGRYHSDASGNLRNVISQEQFRSPGERSRRKENGDDDWKNLQHERTRRLTSQSTMDLNQFESYQNEIEYNDDDGQTPMKKRSSRNANSQVTDSKYRFGRTERGESESVLMNEEEEEVGMKKGRSRKMSAATAALERLSHLGGKGWGGRISSAMSSSGSGSTKLNEESSKKSRIDEDHHEEEEFGRGLVRSSTMIEGGRRRGQSIHQLLKLKRSSIVRN